MSPSESNPPVSKTELQILGLLWETAPQSIREITESLYGDSSTAYYATVQSLVLRLEKKGWVRRDRSSRKHLFFPKKERSDFIGEQIQSVADAVCGGSVAALFGHLAGAKGISSKDRKALRRLIEGDAS